MKTLGQVGFDAYGEHAGWKAFDDRPMPRWDEKLRPDIKEKWEVAAKAILNANLDERALGAVGALIADLAFRPGFEAVWAGLDENARRELVRTWLDLVRHVLTGPHIVSE